ncbi:MAG: hypothetical protein K2P85_13140 [Flavobacteriaceae bacterium]|nr:hypothetical protein [Flavobacteriaceae bacterium]
MKKYIYLFSIFFSLSFLNAQQVQWASKLIKYSSDLGGKQFGIKRVLGKPDVFPQGGYSGNAWTPKNALDGREIVVVGFEKPQSVKQVAVFENLNAGCVTRIFVSTDGEKFEVVWSRKPDYKTPLYKTTLTTDRSYYFKRKRRKIQEVPNVFNPGIEYAILENTVANVVAVKVEFNFALLPGQKQIDAIGISNSDVPIEVSIATNSQFESLPYATKIDLPDIIPTTICITEDGTKLFTSSYSTEKEEIISYTKASNGSWSNKKIETTLNSGASYNYVDASNAQFLLKGGSIYQNGTNEIGFELFTESNGNYQSQGQLKVAAFNNYEDYSDAFLTKDGTMLIMAVETDFSQGGIDLYFTTKKEDGTYGFLQNMGKILNSANDEATPQLLSDGQTLLFSSNGFSTLGNYDIFVSYRLDTTWKNWSEPINLGSKINTADFDGQPYYDEKNEILYYISTVEGKNELHQIKVSKDILLKKI